MLSACRASVRRFMNRFPLDFLYFLLFFLLFLPPYPPTAISFSTMEKTPDAFLINPQDRQFNVQFCVLVTSHLPTTMPHNLFFDGQLIHIFLALGQFNLLCSPGLRREIISICSLLFHSVCFYGFVLEIIFFIQFSGLTLKIMKFKFNLI